MAFRLFRGAEVGGQLAGSHDHLAFQDDGGADGLQHHADDAHDGVHLGQVAAGGAQLLPDIGHRVDAQHLHAQVGQVQHAAGHLHQHRGVAVVQVPLVGVEGGQHPLVHLLAPGKVARGGVGEDLGHRLLILVGHGAVVKAVVEVLVIGVPGHGPAGPFVAGSGVVHHEVQAQADARRPQLLGQGGQVGVGAKGGIHLVEVLHRIAAVVVGMGHLQQGHQVQVGQLLLFQIGQLLRQLLQVPGKEVGVHGHAEHVAPAVPAGVGFPGGVQLFQLGAAGGKGVGHGLFQGAQGLPVVVQLHEQPFQLVTAAGQPFFKQRVVGAAGAGLLHCKTAPFIRQCWFTGGVSSLPGWAWREWRPGGWW